MGAFSAWYCGGRAGGRWSAHASIWGRVAVQISRLKTCWPLKPVGAGFINRMFLSLLYCLSSDTSSEIGEIGLNLPWASGYDWQDLIKLYLHRLCLQSEYCPGRGLRDHCPVIVLTPFNLQAGNRRLGEMQGRGWRGTSVLCVRVSSVSAALPSPGVRPSGLSERSLVW